MGMVIDGTWTEDENIIQNGSFIREPSTFSDPVALKPAAPTSTPPRYWLIASKSCPWSHGATIVRALHGLEAHVGLQIAHGPRIEGYAINGGTHWDVPGTTACIEHLHQLYTLAEPDFTGRSTLPVLWDAKIGKILSNDSRSILRALNDLGRVCGDSALDLAPCELKQDIEATNDWLFSNLNNAVYRAGFAQNQTAYDDAVGTVFGMFDVLEGHLSQHRYLLGDMITLADWRLFPTLVRFDPVYFILHRCCRKRLVDYPTLWSYARALYAMPGIAGTVDFGEIVRGSYLNDSCNNPHGIVPVIPDADWRLPHDREHVGANGTFGQRVRIPIHDRSLS
ncbi:glutathione S-transferase C-terminal domain-containing protein [uncultured Hoeflea sp.]|uniref:glutathione S-transferase C-terminal domain-containing protein n=1 Tax=uncultured Hoeflea sp. TaxID=538666 RepID=UPI0030DC40FA|tara:strand:+ start:546 stop:1556 length:1011 start_codon:yes stop_codon:yes gene_type:complete